METEVISIELHHKLVSAIATPIDYIEKKGNLNYVALAYMRHIANHYYPGWSWTIKKYEIVKNDADGKFGFVTVHGSLEWIEPEGLSRKGEMIAAHRIQYVVDKETREPTDNLLDPGNDIKAANSDTMKKAFNLYLNISDDVYQFEGPELSDVNKEKLAKMIEEVDSEAVRKLNSKMYGVNNRNLVDIIQRLKYEKGKLSDRPSD